MGESERSTGLDLPSFDFDDLAKAVIPKVDELLYDTLAYIVKTDSAAEHFLLGTDSVSDRDGRHALLDLIKGCVPPGAELGVAAGPGVAGAAYSGVDERVLEVLGMLTTRLEKIEAAIKYQKAGGAASLPRNKRGKGLDGFRAGSSPTPPVGFDRDNRRVPFPSAIAAGGRVAADDGLEACAAAVAEYGAPAVLAGGESDEIDVSAYGFTVPGSGSGVLSELETLTGQPTADSFVGPSEAIGDCSIDEFLSDSGAEEIEELEIQRSFVGTLSGRSTGRPQQTVGFGAPPHGLRPNFVLLACFLGLLDTGFTGAAGIGGASGSGMPAAEDIQKTSRRRLRRVF
ncbi:hypothetical protein CYMTET_47177 [Cymbomonas tetramitiformis]|uniref:Uncharacterized protein n=1 Tax=Cymbomonas tetramitiformis TaxID=36881 RepID=A0AAE0EWU0_9CHLO|nr:hypothetical protein CYMTET_47177 [Cymbomonas tetramitiformis]